MSQPDLFTGPEPEQKPINNDRSNCKFNAFMRANHGVSVAWCWVKVDTLGDYKTPREQAYFQIEGAEYPEVWASGKKKGRTNYRKPKAGTERTVIVAFKDFDAFEWSES